MGMSAKLQVQYDNPDNHGCPRTAKPLRIAGCLVETPENILLHAGQKAIISQIIRATRDKKHAVLESPTGTGKTLAILCALLSFHKNRTLEFVREKLQGLPSPELPKRIIFTSRTHSQLKQILNESKKCKSLLRYEVASNVNALSEETLEELNAVGRARFQKHQCVFKKTFRAVTLGSRRVACVRDDKSSMGKSIDAACSDLLRCDRCEHFNAVQSLSRRLPVLLDIEETAEKLMHRPAAARGCLYFASRLAARSADMILCPYQYVVDPIIRSRSGISQLLPDSIVVVDEGHNLEDTCREAASFYMDASICTHVISQLHDSLAGSEMPEHLEPLLSVFTAILEWMCQHTSPSMHAAVALLQLLASWGLTPATLPILAECISTSKRSEKESKLSISSTSPAENIDTALSVSERLIQVCEFVFSMQETMHASKESWLDCYCLRFSNIGGIGRIELVCFDAAPCMENVVSQCTSLIVTSGTLTPLGDFVQQLGISVNYRLSAPHVVDTNNVWAGIISVLSDNMLSKLTFSTLKQEKLQDALGSCILRLAYVIPDGLVVFAPSHFVLSLLFARWQKTGLLVRLNRRKHVFREISGSDHQATRKLVLNYTKLCSNQSSKGAVLFGVYRGNLSEGIDFSGSACRAVVLLGIPLASATDWKMEMKRKYEMRRKTTMEVNSWYVAHAMRASNQAAGRCIRNQQDLGAIIYIDARYEDTQYRDYISSWIKGTLRKGMNWEQASASISNFFARHDLASKKAATNSSKRSSDSSTDTVLTKWLRSKK